MALLAPLQPVKLTARSAITSIDQIRHHLAACLQSGQTLHYAGRARSPSPAAGHLADHVAEQTALVADALKNPLRGEITAE